ncbi:membrane protein insertion efficiency factor YidD [uncultured Phycicoccus sp.]|uniref:membrane protein insertion efficiency factor YidD n=1 Tax=uncultured Phycicoccus sp. TaxID=661422 RepID=UPI00260E4A2C|nr:membrane protein insertion efficiency factor YidD [uncultured Phycicoccus sp.]
MSPGRVLVTPVLWLIRLYQRFISPLRPPTCRYYPSCSAYAVTSLERFGPLRGTWMAAARLLRCHPWTPGGVDHVPDRDPVTGRPVPGTTGPKPYAGSGTTSDASQP